MLHRARFFSELIDRWPPFKEVGLLVLLRTQCQVLLPVICTPDEESSRSDLSCGEVAYGEVASFSGYGIQTLTKFHFAETNPAYRKPTLRNRRSSQIPLVKYRSLQIPFTKFCSLQITFITKTVLCRYRSLQRPFFADTVHYKDRSLQIPFITKTVLCRYPSSQRPFFADTVHYKDRSLQIATVFADTISAVKNHCLHCQKWGVPLHPFSCSEHLLPNAPRAFCEQNISVL